ncbi:MAG TPA: fatty acid--CoA ligase family protein [Mycobacteriales bacterium]|nr:fatty acid--CoA ligase family protein [Mycobacteriales bacterium]
MSLSVLLEMAAAGHGERTALGPREAGISFEQLHTRATTGASLIAVRSPTHVAFVGRAAAAFPIAMFSSVIAGVPFAPLNYRLSAAHLATLIHELDGPLVLADSEYLPTLGDCGAEVISTADFVAGAERAAVYDGPQAPDDGPAIVLFTSGTTSSPKAVVLKHQHLASYIFSTVEFGSAAEETALVTVPPYHVAGVGAVLSNLYAGRRVVYLPDFDPHAWLRLVVDQDVTSAMLVPTMLARIVDAIGPGPVHAPSLRHISYGGARMPRPVIERALDLFPQVDFVNAYGLTETSSTIALLGPAEHRAAIASRDPAVRARLASIGRPVPGIEIEIRDAAGNPIETGHTGLLSVRGQQVSGEYRRLGSALDPDGWLPTRDLARRDADGYLFIEGRADDTIIRGGENIAPAEIEDVLVLHPAVREAAVVGLPDDEWGERICAVVVRRLDATVGVEDLRTFVRERLRGSRTPDEVRWRDELPHTPTGKLLRRDLVAELVAEPIDGP